MKMTDFTTGRKRSNTLAAHMDLRQVPTCTHRPLCWELFGAREHDCSSSSCLSLNPLWGFCCIDTFSCFHQLCLTAQ